MLTDTHGQMAFASSNEMRNWNQPQRPSGKKAAPPKPACVASAIASAVAVNVRVWGMHGKTEVSGGEQGFPVLERLLRAAAQNPLQRVSWVLDSIQILRGLQVQQFEVRFGLRKLIGNPYQPTTPAVKL